MYKILGISLLLFAFNSCSSSDQYADTIYYNGTLITMNDEEPIAEAIAISKGKILAVGTQKNVLNYTNHRTQLIDLSNKTMIPGFIDAHSHLLGTALHMVSANLYPTPDGSVTNIDTLLSTLKTYHDSKPDLFKETGWIVGFGYDDSQLSELRHPNKFDLDTVFPDIPVYLIHQSGHLGVANSKALEILEITSETENVSGSIIQRVGNTQEPNGVLEENIHLSVLQKVTDFSPFYAAKMLQQGLNRMMEFGYTTAQDGRTTKIQVLLIRIIAFFKKFSIDIISYPDVFKAPKEHLSFSKEYKNGFRVGGMKLSLDGSPQAKTAWRDKPYVVPPHGHKDDYVGYPTVTRDEAFEKVELAFASNIQIIVHANGEAAIDLFLDAVENAQNKYGYQDNRPVLIHGQFTRKDQVDRIKQLQVFPSLFPLHTFFWGEWHRTQTIGEPDVHNISPTKWFEDAGMKFTSHHDAPITLPNNMRVLWATVNRLSRDGKIIGPEQRVSVMTGLKSLTIWSAYQHFEENQKGSLEKGKLADLVILSDNPLEINMLDISNITVLQTIKEGTVVFQK